MTTRFGHFEVSDVRFPASRTLNGSDAVNTAPYYSAAYVVVHTTGSEVGHGFVFTIGRGNEVVAAAIRAVEPLGVELDVDEVLSNMGAFWRLLTHDSQLRWLGPEKGVMHMAIGAVVNAVWDLYARREGQLVRDQMGPDILLSIDANQVWDVDRVAGVNENLAILLLAAKFGVPVCPHAGGVGLCEIVQHLSMFDYVAVSGSTEGRWTEFVDHLHEHFVEPVKVVDGRYRAPTAPGAGTEIRSEPVADGAFPAGRAWRELSHTG